MGGPGSLGLVTPDGTVARGQRATIDDELRNLQDRGMLVVTEDHECDPHAVAKVEDSWRGAGLIGRPTNETLSAVMTADRLGFDLIAIDSDVRTLASYMNVSTMTVADLATAVAA